MIWLTGGLHGGETAWHMLAKMLPDMPLDSRDSETVAAWLKKEFWHQRLVPGKRRIDSNTMESAIYSPLIGPGVVTERIPKRFNLDPIRDIQVLTPMNRGELGSHSLNSELQARLNGSAEPKVTRFGVTFSPGDKVIQTVNNYDKEVFNGDIGRILEIDTKESTLLIDYDGRDVAYEFSELDEVQLA